MRQNQFSSHLQRESDLQIGRIELASEPATFFCFCRFSEYQAKRNSHPLEINEIAETDSARFGKGNQRGMRELLEEVAVEAGLLERVSSCDTPNAEFSGERSESAGTEC